MRHIQCGFGPGLGASVIQNPVALLLIVGVLSWIAWQSWSDYKAAQRKQPAAFLRADRSERAIEALAFFRGQRRQGRTHRPCGKAPPRGPVLDGGA